MGWEKLGKRLISASWGLKLAELGKIEDNHKTKEALKIKMTSSPMPRLTMTILACLCYSEVLLFARPQDNSCTLSTGIFCPVGGQGCGGVSSFAEEG